MAERSLGGGCGVVTDRVRFWAYVTAFGAAWGAFEITVGAFLHALRVPFDGTFLASVSAAFLVAQRQVLPVRGASLATGAVAALCKSISPGGMILGPMVAILAESALVEVALLAAPRARSTAFLAGALAALWATFQKVISKVVYFGAGIIDLYLSALARAGRELSVSATAGWWTLVVFCLLVMLVGAAGGLLGRAVGRAAATRLAAEEGAHDP